MSADEYRKDFTEPGDLEEFDTLLARSSHQCIVPPHGADASTDPDARNDAYLAGGKAVVDASEILIAIWDGKPASAKGGTGDIVEYALHSNKMVLWIDCNAPAKPVRRLLSDTKITGERLDWKPAPMPATGRELSSAFHCLAAYNRDPAFDPNAWAAHVESARTEFAKAADHAGVPQGPQRPALDTLIPQYARADLLALRYQRLHEGSTQWLFILAAGAVSAAVAQTFFLPDYAWTIFFEVAVLAAILALLRISRAEDWHDKWLHDRHLAEHLRTRMYLSVLGEPPSRAARPAIELLPFYEGPSRWVQSAIDEIEAEVPAAIRTPAELHSIRKFLAAGWIRDQANYHHSNSKKKQRRSRAIHRLGTGVYLITIAAATLHAFGIGGHGDGSHSPFQIGKAISVLTILLPVWVANLHAINNLLERDRIATRSSRMAGLLGQLAREMESTHNDQETYEIAQRAALVMASENHEWVVSLSFRGPVLPA